MPDLKIGISGCLAGNRVRYDGTDKLVQQLLDRLKIHADLVPVCPEVAIGMGTPRPPIQLTGSLASPRARQVENPELDFTGQLRELALQIASSTNFHGFVFKARSPSCGYRTTPVYINAQPRDETVSGIFAQTLLDALPGLPACDESILIQPLDFEHFINQCLEFRKSTINKNR